MFKNILGLLLLVLMISCSKSEKAELILSEPAPTVEVDPTVIEGKWKLVETYSDPGDGSGNFAPVNSNKTFEFFKNGTLVSNGEICSLTTTTQNPSTTNYSVRCKTIICPNNFHMSFSLENGELLVHFPCIEGCTFKFEKISGI